MSEHTSPTFFDDLEFDHDAGYERTHLLDINTADPFIGYLGQHDLDFNSYGSGIEDGFENTPAAPIGCPTTTAASTDNRDKGLDVAVAQSSQGALNLCFTCSSMLTEHASLAAVPDQQSFPLVRGDFPGLTTNIPNTPPPRPAPEPYPTGPHQSGTGMALSMSGIPDDTPRDLGVSQQLGDNGTRRYPPGFWATPGRRKMTNMDEELQCWSCLLDHNEKRVFSSTNSLRNHERKYHEKPKEGGAKPRKVGNRPRKVMHEQITSLKGRMR